jgi:hypothetical protein
MNLQTLLPAAPAALTITGFAAAASAAPAADGDSVIRAVAASPGLHEVFMRLVKVPKSRSLAETGGRRMMRDDAAMRAMCDRMMGDLRGAAPAPKG